MAADTRIWQYDICIDELISPVQQGARANRFICDVREVIGGTDADGWTQALDLGVIRAQAFAVTEKRVDTDGDGTVGAFDLGVAWSYNGDFASPKP